jgi:streptogramin lyase
LWFAGDELNAFTLEQTHASTDMGPAVLVTPSSGVATFHDLVFDPDGNLWTIPISGDQILRLARTGLGGEVRPAPDLTIKSAALAAPITLTFDTAGNLWVVNYNGAGPSTANIVRFDAVRGMHGGDQMLTPSLTIGPGTDKTMKDGFAQGTALAFDPKGNLWFGGISSLMRFENPSGLNGTIVAAPEAIISTGDSFASIAFDGVGSLWVTAAKAGYFALRIDSPSRLVGTVSYTPDARVKLSATTSTFAGGMAFDATGSLWIAMSDQIVALANPSSMLGNVSPGAAVVLGLPAQSFPDLASKLAFWPMPPSSPP